MANKYIIHGATYCGDGTSSVVASSNGGVGAWNDINVFEGTAPAYGTAPAAGDVVYIRSKTSSGADITRTLADSVTLGSSSATLASPITWVWDNGSVWSGVDGTLTYECPSTYVVTARQYNKIVARSEDALVVREMNTAPSYKNYFGGNTTHHENILFDFATNVSAGNGCRIGAYSGNSIVVNPHILSKNIPEQLFNNASYSVLTIINPRIELLGATASIPLFRSSSTGGYLTIIGGSVSGAAATSAVPVFTNPSQGAKLRTYGFQFPHEMPLSIGTIVNHETTIHCTGSDGLSGVRIKELWGEASSRTDAYYPVLNAQLPDSVGTKWSWWVYPYGASILRPAVFEFGKVFTEEAGVRTIRLELLAGTTFSDLKADSVWMSVSYTDAATGLAKSLSTFKPGENLTDSSAVWSPDPPTYGATAYNEKYLEVTTPTSIKKDTMIHVAVFVSAKAALVAYTLILCPDFLVLT